MSLISILHNPRCSKSRQTLTLLQEKGIEPEVVEYLKTPLSAQALKVVFDKLNVEQVRDMMRTKEAVYKELNLGAETVTEDMLFEAMVKEPKLIERPVVINGDSARIGRPPEAVLEIV